MKSKVFLGGTCNNSTWRDELDPIIQIDKFNPVVEDWTSECQEIEMDEKENKCDVHLYVITSQMTGVFSIAEVIDSVHNKTKKTILDIKNLEAYRLILIWEVMEIRISLAGKTPLLGIVASPIGIVIHPPSFLAQATFR